MISVTLFPTTAEGQRVIEAILSFSFTHADYCFRILPPSPDGKGRPTLTVSIFPPSTREVDHQEQNSDDRK